LNKRGFLLVVCAPSGTGKTTIYKDLLCKHPDLKFSVSYTTRKKRADEVDGLDYFFIDRERFIRMKEKNEFIEWASVHNELYGTERKQIGEYLQKGKICILDLDVQGALNVMKEFDDAVTVFIRPPSLEELERRLKERGTESEKKVKLRLLNAQKELEYTDHFQYIVVNDRVEAAVKRLEEIIEIKIKKRK